MAVAVGDEGRHQNTRLGHQLEEVEQDIGVGGPILKEEQDIHFEEQILEKMENDCGGGENEVD